MCYYNEDTGKEIVIRDIHLLAAKLGYVMEFGPMYTHLYEDLIDLREELTIELHKNYPIGVEGKHYGKRKTPRPGKT